MNDHGQPTTAVDPVAGDARLNELKRWFEVSFDPFGDAPFEGLTEYSLRKLPDIRFVEGALESIAEQLHTCKAQCPMQFRQWCYRQIDKQAAKLTPRGEKRQRTNTKAFDYEQHGDCCFITLQDSEGQHHAWKIPTDWLEQARALWPVYIRRFPDGRPYVSRKVSVIHPDGRRLQKDTAVHRLFLGLSAVRHEVADNLEVQTRDGSWLNYCDGNLYLRAGSDLLDRATANGIAADYNPRKKNPWYKPGHEARVNSWLHPPLDKVIDGILEEKYQNISALTPIG